MKQVGNYSILKKMGESGYGEVYLAEHKFIKKKYILKLFSPDLIGDASFVKRFERDVSIFARLSHPSVLTLCNIFYEQGNYFLISDSMVDEEGNSLNLHNFLKEKDFIVSERAVETILRQIASCLDYVHSIEVDGVFLAHGGIKPSNIFIKERGDDLYVFLSDFGISRLLGEKKILQRAYLKGLEDDEISLMKYAFLSPEQKHSKEVSWEVDNYAFGVLAYFLITHELPEGCFEFPSKLFPKLELNWDFLIYKCLQKDPKKRPQNLTEALNSYLSADRKDVASLEMLCWNEVSKKLENSMQMSFEFSSKQPENSELRPVITPQKISRPTYESDPGAIFKKELNVSHYQPQKIEAKEIDPLLTKMVIIPGGSFFRGSNKGTRDEMPRHRISLSSFAMDIHPVTNEQFVRFLEFMGGEKDSNNNDIIRLKDSRIKRSGGKLIVESGYLKHPVVGITWYGAVAYAKWVGKRLPFEAEWEIASLGGVQDTLYPTGDKIDHSQANFFSSDTTSVMSYPSNGYDLYDMVGNVYEWCQDWYAYNYYDVSLQEPENPKGPQQGVYRALRGGCWKSLKEDLRCSHRHRNNPGSINRTYGFRCAADVS